MLFPDLAVYMGVLTSGNSLMNHAPFFFFLAALGFELTLARQALLITCATPPALIRFLVLGFFFVVEQKKA
jgi:hypothetical protein